MGETNRSNTNGNATNTNRNTDVNQSLNPPAIFLLETPMILRTPEGRRSPSPLPNRAQSPNRRVLGSISNIPTDEDGGDCTDGRTRTPGLLQPPMHANENLLVPRGININSIITSPTLTDEYNKNNTIKSPRQRISLDRGTVKSKKINQHSIIHEEHSISSPTLNGDTSNRQPTESNLEDKFQGLRPMGSFCGAIIDDYKRRSSVYLSDFTDGFHPKAFTAFVFMFFATFASTVALGVVVDDMTSGTNKHMGVTEMVLSLSIGGMVHSLFAGCPMAVLRPTGPITLFIIKLYGLAAVLKVDFFQWFAWVGLFVGVYMIAIAVLNQCHHITHATRFLHDMFSFFVCTIYIHDGVAGIVGLWPNNERQVGVKTHWQDVNCESVGCAYFSILLYCCTLFLALLLNAATSSKLFNAHGRTLIKDNALMIAVVVAICIGYGSPAAQDYTNDPNHSNVDYIPHVSLSKGVVPTFNRLAEYNNSFVNTERRWWIGLTTHRNPSRSMQGQKFNTTTLIDDDICGNPGVGDDACAIRDIDIFYAALAAVPITLWFYFDQLFSCVLHQVSQGPNGGNLVKGAYYHSSFLWVGICNLVLPLFGLPFVTASLPHSPHFTRALQIRDRDTGQVKKVIDNRVAPFFMYLFCGLALLLPGSKDQKLLEVVPKGVVYGILTFVGVAGILPESKNEFSKRILLLFTAPSTYPKHETYTQVSVLKMHLFTFIQVLALVICWTITVSNSFGDNEFWHYFGLSFPLWIVALIPIRKRVLLRWFTHAELNDHLDVATECGIGDGTITSHQASTVSSSEQLPSVNNTANSAAVNLTFNPVNFTFNQTIA